MVCNWVRWKIDFLIKILSIFLNAIAFASGNSRSLTYKNLPIQFHSVMRETIELHALSAS